MICSRCGKEVNNASKFCPSCGNSINSFTNQTNLGNSNMKKKISFSFTKKQQAIILSLLGVIILLLSVILFVPSNDSRTIMIYIVGSNLETDAQIVTTELNSIDPGKIDLNKTNILLYTGGTKKWHNFISNEEIGVYILKANGFKKLESQEQLNLGDPKTLTDFLKFGYNNYKADKYDLILYDHGGAIDGAIYDDISGDNLSLEDMSIALNDSPFNKHNKLETVLFRTCLNGTIEIANTFKDFSDYLIASEEISYGSNYSNVLGFLNNVLPSDNGLEFGKKFVDAYEKQMQVIDPFQTVLYTYSVVDLSKINNLNNALEEYIQSIDITENYKNIVTDRSNLYQYGSEQVSVYDMIDLYEFVKASSKYAKNDADKLLNLISQAVKYNRSSADSSHGISIYFPYNGTKAYKYKFLDVYSDFDYLQNYRNFISTFNNMQQSPSGYSFNITNNNVTANEDNADFSIELTDEQLETFSNGLFAIFERDSEHPDYYRAIFSSDDTTLNNKTLQANINNMMLKMNNGSGNFGYILSYYRKANNGRRTVDGVLYKKDADFTDDEFMNSVTLTISNDGGNPFISSAKLKSVNERMNGVLLDLNDYGTLEIWNGTYKILDENGNYTEEWESAPRSTGYSSDLSEVELINSGLDKGDNYYGLFILKDIYGNTSYSKLIKVGE